MQVLRSDRDVIGGALLITCGLAYAIYAMSQYNIGTLRRMGPGMFPVMLGFALTGLGATLFLTAFLKAEKLPRIRIWTPIFVLSSIGAFALMIRPFGLFPAIIAVTVISSLAELKVRPVSLTLLCASLCGLSWLIFRVGLNMPIPLYRWPF